MKIAFIEAKDNKIKMFQKARELEKKKSDVHVKQYQAMDITKTLLEAKKKLKECDAAIIFITYKEEQSEDVELVKRKYIDIELEAEKPIFLIAMEEEVLEEDLQASAAEAVQKVGATLLSKK